MSRKFKCNTGGKLVKGKIAENSKNVTKIIQRKKGGKLFKGKHDGKFKGRIAEN